MPQILHILIICIYFIIVYSDRTKLPDNGAKQKICGFNDSSVTNGGKVCEVDLSRLGPCSPKNGYGFNNSQPCIFLKLNKIYGWEPQFYDNTNELPDDMPQELKDHIAKKSVEEVSILFTNARQQSLILYLLQTKNSTNPHTQNSLKHQ